MYGVFRVLYLIHHGSRLPDDPTVVVWQDRPLQVCIVLWGISAGLISALVVACAPWSPAARASSAATSRTRSTAAGYEVRTLDVNPPEAPGPHEFVRADVRDAPAVRAAVRGCDVVVDNAALVPVTRAERGRVPLGERRTAAGPRWMPRRRQGAYVVRISSSAIYGVPRELPVHDAHGAGALRPLRAQQGRGRAHGGGAPRRGSRPSRACARARSSARAGSGCST